MVLSLCERYYFELSGNEFRWKLPISLFPFSFHLTLPFRCISLFPTSILLPPNSLPPSVSLRLSACVSGVFCLTLKVMELSSFHSSIQHLPPFIRSSYTPKGLLRLNHHPCIRRIRRKSAVHVEECICFGCVEEGGRGGICPAAAAGDLEHRYQHLLLAGRRPEMPPLPILDKNSYSAS